MGKTTDYLKKIVQIDSPSGHEEKMAEFLLSWLKSVGFSVKQDKTGNIYAVNKGEGNPLLISAHMDTVEPGQGIKPIIKNGFVESSEKTILGSDNKASIAAIMSAVEDLHQERALHNRKLEIIFTVKEETGGGVEYFPLKWIGSKLALVFDCGAPLGGIVLGSPFIENFHITYTGKAAHASNPDDGKNAFAPAIELLKQTEVGEIDKDSTVNIGLIKGGSGINTVPEEIKISGEVRSMNGNKFKNTLKKIERSAKNISKKYGTKIKFEKKAYSPGYLHKQADENIQKIAEVLKNMKFQVKYFKKAAVSDANIFNQAGIKAINLAYANQNAHTTNERIAVKDLENLEKIIKELIIKL